MTAAIAVGPPPDEGGKVFLNDKGGKPIEVQVGDIVFHRKSKHGELQPLFDGDCEVTKITPPERLEIGHLESGMEMVVNVRSLACSLVWMRRP